MPLLPASLIEPVWVEFAALIGADQQPEFSPTHPWGCHRRRISDRVVFDHLIAALVHGSGYERIATPGCSDRTIRRRLRDWAQAGHTKVLLRLVLAAFDRMIGLDLDDLSVDGSITKSPCGGEVSGRSPVDRGKQGTKRSVACDGGGIPLHLVAARANDHDLPLLEPTLAGICDMIGPLPDRPVHAPGPRLRLTQNPRSAGDPGIRRRDRRQGRPGPDSGREAVAGRAHQCVARRSDIDPISREGFGGRFLGRMADLEPKGEGDNSMPENPVVGPRGKGRRTGGTRVIWRKLDCLKPSLQLMKVAVRRKDL